MNQEEYIGMDVPKLGHSYAGTSVYNRRHRAELLAKLVEPGVRIRAEH